MKGQVLWALVTVTWRERLSRPVVVALCGLLCAAQTAFAVSGSHDLEDPVLVLALILGAGSIGRDLSSGVLALLFARPIVRTTYVIAKWTAVSLAAGTLGCATLIVQAVLLRSRGIDISAASPYIRNAPHALLWPSGALALTVLAFIMLGDAVRDALDPKLR